jgi:hypothetical protein
LHTIWNNPLRQQFNFLLGHNAFKGIIHPEWPTKARSYCAI